MTAPLDLATPETAPQEMWQTLHPPGTFPDPSGREHATSFPGTLPDGRQIVLPIRTLPGDGRWAVASLIVNQASFAVEDALMDAMAERLAPFGAEIIVAVPSLGLTLANGVARRLGHPRMAALGSTRKFWYDDALSEPSSSISSRMAPKTLYLDPRLQPVVDGRRVAVVDDVVSTGSSLSAILRLLSRAGARPVVVAAAMLQTERWRATLAALPSFHGDVTGVFTTPLLHRTASGSWTPATPAETTEYAGGEPL